LILGILADSHGHAERTRRVVARLVDGGAQLLIHLGDIESEEVLDELTPLPARIVFGNCDIDAPLLRRHAERLGIEVDHPMGWLRDADRVIAYTHGDDEQLLAHAVEAGAHYLLHGHTHRRCDERRDATRVINPGALVRADRYTAALLDPAAGRLCFVEP